MINQGLLTNHFFCSLDWSDVTLHQRLTWPQSLAGWPWHHWYLRRYITCFPLKDRLSRAPACFTDSRSCLLRHTDVNVLLIYVATLTITDKTSDLELIVTIPKEPVKGAVCTALSVERKNHALNAFRRRQNVSWHMPLHPRHIQRKTDQARQYISHCVCYLAVSIWKYWDAYWTF